MKTHLRKAVLVLCASLVLITFASTTGFSQSAATRLPNPVLILVGAEPFDLSGKKMTRYRYAVDNSAAYPNTLFEPSPALPPCGKNANSARTWVDIYDQGGKRLQGFCALKTNKDLGELWFALERDEIPPSWIYIELNDRKANTKYKSNLAETTL